MAQRVVSAIKIKDVVGEPTVAIQAALNAGTIQKNPNGKAAPGQFIPMGYFVGRVSDQVDHVTKRKGASGLEEEKSYPKLAGAFKCWSVDPERDTHVSASAFLLDHLVLHMGNVIREARNIDPDVTLEVLLEIGVETSDKSSTGFTWALRDMAPPTVAADPLALLVAKVKGGNVPALPKPEAEQPQGEAEPSVEQEQAAEDVSDAVSKDTGAGKEDHGNKAGRGKHK